MALEKTVSGRAVVYYLMDGSEAEKQGLKKGDVMVEIDGRDANNQEYQEL